jgi:hypothetical protein
MKLTRGEMKNVGKFLMTQEQENMDGDDYLGTPLQKE